MKNLKRILMLVLALALVFTLFACGDKTCKHKDEDEDGLCDDCDECLECIDEDEDGLCDNCDACLECVDEDEDGFRCVMCPACGEKIYFDESMDPSDLICPACGKDVCGDDEDSEEV